MVEEKSNKAQTSLNPRRRYFSCRFVVVMWDARALICWSVKLRDGKEGIDWNKQCPYLNVMIPPQATVLWAQRQHWFTLLLNAFRADFKCSMLKKKSPLMWDTADKKLCIFIHLSVLRFWAFHDFLFFFINPNKLLSVSFVELYRFVSVNFKYVTYFYFTEP